MKKIDKRKLLVAVIAFLCLVGIFCFVLQNVEKKYNKKNSENISKEDNSDDDIESITRQGTLTLYGNKYDYFDEMETYLLIGTDASGVDSNEAGKYRGGMADFILLVIVNKTDNTYSFLQLDRDTITEVALLQEDGSAYASADIQLCTAHWYGGSESAGSENTVNAVSAMLGNLEINGYYALNMEDITALNHAVGGVTVTLEDDFSELDAAMKKGKTIKLSDSQAFHYVHDRYNVADGSNISRMKRQRGYMKAFLTKVMKKTKKKPTFVNMLYKQLKDVADTDITGRQVSMVMNQVNRGTGQGIHTFEGESKIGKALGDGKEHAEFYIDKNSMIDVMTKLYKLEKRAD